MGLPYVLEGDARTHHPQFAILYHAPADIPADRERNLEDTYRRWAKAHSTPASRLKGVIGPKGYYFRPRLTEGKDDFPTQGELALWLGHLASMVPGTYHGPYTPSHLWLPCNNKLDSGNLLTEVGALGCPAVANVLLQPANQVACHGVLLDLPSLAEAETLLEMLENKPQVAQGWFDDRPYTWRLR